MCPRLLSWSSGQEARALLSDLSVFSDYRTCNSVFLEHWIVYSRLRTDCSPWDPAKAHPSLSQTEPYVLTGCHCTKQSEGDSLLSSGFRYWEQAPRLEKLWLRLKDGDFVSNSLPSLNTAHARSTHALIFRPIYERLHASDLRRVVVPAHARTSGWMVLPPV